MKQNMYLYSLKTKSKSVIFIVSKLMNIKIVCIKFMYKIYSKYHFVIIILFIYVFVIFCDTISLYFFNTFILFQT